MNKKDLQRFRRLIEAEIQRVRGSLDVLEEDVRSEGDASTPVYSNHMADIGSDVMDRERTLLHASQESQYLADLEAALRRVDDGTYGRCESCGRPIPVRRLEAFPAARLCVPCKEAAERGRV